MSRDAAARSELQNGSLALHVISCDPNNYDKLQMKYLMNCLLVFQQSLTNMPPAYMARLVFDPRHRNFFQLLRLPTILKGVSSVEKLSKMPLSDKNGNG